ncbi:MAG: GrpB family protein [Gordonibacter sp.]|nr:GrpB family protein [Gordonibacter sp.]
MKKPLSEMTLEELWELFPIVLSEHEDCWVDWYAEEERRIRGFLPMPDVRINHIGSTAIRGIWAKPTVDILLEIPETASVDDLKAVLTGNGYSCMSEGDRRKSFNRGYTSEGFAERVFHLHLRYCGDNDELYFRDYLNDRREIAEEYEQLKLGLWKRYEHDRDGYTEAKTDFVRQQTAEARMVYAGRY